MLCAGVNVSRILCKWVKRDGSGCQHGGKSDLPISITYPMFATWADDDNDNYLVAWFGLTATIETLNSAGGRELQQAGAITLQFPIQHHTRDLGQWQLCSARALQSDCESCSKN